VGGCSEITIPVFFLFVLRWFLGSVVLTSCFLIFIRATKARQIERVVVTHRHSYSTRRTHPEIHQLDLFNLENKEGATNPARTLKYDDASSEKEANFASMSSAAGGSASAAASGEAAHAVGNDSFDFDEDDAIHREDIDSILKSPARRRAEAEAEIYTLDTCDFDHVHTSSCYTTHTTRVEENAIEFSQSSKGIPLSFSFFFLLQRYLSSLLSFFFYF
jgi:hypothetical protein